MLRLAPVMLLCLFFRGGTGQFQEVYPSFCPSSGLVGARCDLTSTVMPSQPNTLISQVNHLRCQSGCLMDVSWTATGQHARPPPACTPPSRPAWTAAIPIRPLYVRACVRCSRRIWYHQFLHDNFVCGRECVCVAGGRVGGWVGEWE